MYGLTTLFPLRLGYFHLHGRLAAYHPYLSLGFKLTYRLQLQAHFRPLDTYSEVLESHIHGLIVEHLNTHSPLSSNQWGFAAKKFTVSALISATHDWFRHIDAGKDIAAVFLDLRKAFETVPHQPLLDKLSLL